MMKAARVHEQGRIVIEEIPIPQLGEKDALIKVHRVGICGTDVGVYHGHVPAKLPVTLGHEFSGTIAKLGSSSLGGFKEGDPVTACGGWGCGYCELCQKGMGLFCKDRVSLGRTADGCLAEFVKVDYRAVHRLPPNVSFDEGQNFVNIACTVRGFKKIPFQLGNTVAIFGPGNIGLIMLQLLKFTGAYQAVVVGTRDFRLEMAKTFGATHVVNVVVEATGNASSFQSCCDVIKAKGSLISFGIFSEKVKEFDLSFLYYKEPVIYGSKGGEGGFEEALHLLEGKRLNITPMITHRFSLEETAKGFKTFEDKNENSLRILVEPSM
jgi:threonine dehydrogenase-like Zn-dependent dehydrogenase